MRSLWRGTSDLASHTATSGAAAGALFADNTRDAIERDRPHEEPVERLEARLKLVEEETKGGIDLTRFYAPPGGGPAIVRLRGLRGREIGDRVARGFQRHALVRGGEEAVAPVDRAAGWQAARAWLRNQGGALHALRFTPTGD